MAASFAFNKISFRSSNNLFWKLKEGLASSSPLMSWITLGRDTSGRIEPHDTKAVPLTPLASGPRQPTPDNSNELLNDPAARIISPDAETA